MKKVGSVVWVPTSLLRSDRKLDGYMSGITEIQLMKIDGHDFNDTPRFGWEVLKVMYDLILKKDPLWHFLYEGSFTALRFSQKNRKKIFRLLKNRGVEWNDCGGWGPDSQPPTKKYQMVFTYIFHGFSVLAMEQDFDKEWLTVADRVIHCYSNMMFYHAEGLRRAYGPDWEAMFVAMNSIRRARYVGQMDERWRIEQEQEKNRKRISSGPYVDKKS